MNESISKRIFLSHKGADKAMVIEFKEALESVGYEPWIDKDDMPPGTEIERGLREGMDKSCGVVFFITSAFEDAGFLRGEIDRALLQKREKGDRFAIVTLLFDKEAAQVPGPLRDFVWAEPKTQLEALRAIVQALPVLPGKADWKDGAGTPPQDSQDKTVSIPSEAAEILRAAVTDGYLFFNDREYGSHGSLAAGDRNLIPEDNHRVVAKWKDALDQLCSLGLVKKKGMQGMHELTEAGYKAAEELASHSQESSPEDSLSPKAKELLEKAKNADGYISVRVATAFQGSTTTVTVGNEALHGNEWDDARRELERRGLIKFVDNPRDNTRRYEIV